MFEKKFHSKHMHKNFFVIAVATLFFVSSCKKDQCEGVNELDYHIEGPSSVNAGDIVHLKAAAINDVEYEWTGPENFWEFDGEVFIAIYNEHYAGTYTVHYTSASSTCIDHIETFTINLNTVTAPCSPTLNHISWGGYDEPMGLSSSGLGNYDFGTSSMNTDMNFHFIDLPVSGVYTCVGGGTSDFDMKQNEVIVSLTSFNYYYAAVCSQIYVSVDSGVATISFCNITMGPSTATGSFSVTL